MNSAPNMSNDTPKAVHQFAGVDPQSPEGHLRSVLFQLLGGCGAESVESAAMRLVQERDIARSQRDVAEGELGDLRRALRRLRDAWSELGGEVKP